MHRACHIGVYVSVGSGYPLIATKHVIQITACQSISETLDRLTKRRSHGLPPLNRRDRAGNGQEVDHLIQDRSVSPRTRKFHRVTNGRVEQRVEQSVTRVKGEVII